MRGPVVTVDVSKGSCHYQPFIEKGKPLRKPKVLHDTIEGFADLTAIIEKTKQKSGQYGVIRLKWISTVKITETIIFIPIRFR